MILSNRKLKLIIISLLLLIFAYFLGIFKVNAQVSGGYAWNETNSVQGNLYTDIDSSAKIGIVNFERVLFRNSGNGTITFTIISAPISSNADGVVMSVRALGQVADYECSLSGGTWYVDNDTQRLLQQVTCPFNSDYNNGFKGLQFTRDGAYGKTRIYFPVYYSFVYGTDSSSQVSDITSAINSSANAIISATNGDTTSIINAISGQTQAIINAINSSNTTINNIQNNTSDIKDSINDSSIDTNQATNSASTWNNKNATNGTITQLLTLPITLLQAIVNGLQTSCSSFSLGSLFGTNIILPCIDLSSLIGNGLFTTIDILFSGFMILSIGKKLIKIFNDFTNLKSNQMDELYGGGSR